MSQDNEMIEVLYHSSYGGYSVSKQACELYNQRQCMGTTLTEHQINYEVKRHDPVLIQIYRELGSKFSRNGNKNISIMEIDKKYTDFYTISEYDGLESVEINYDKWELFDLKNKIRNIIKMDSSNDDKIAKLMNLNL